jgi:predicted DNA-binding transcriptional regulator YafY
MARGGAVRPPDSCDDAADQEIPLRVDPTQVHILYRNYKGVTGWRKIVPQGIRFASNQWHPEDQWLLEALDLEKGAPRSFAMREIQEWKVAD